MQKDFVSTVLWTAFIVLLLIWLVGMVTLKTVSMAFHLLLVVAAAMLVLRLLKRNNGHSAE